MAQRPETMDTAHATRPRFFWQGVLIVLPVAVLAIFALVLLRQDLAMVDHEAREKAQVEAGEIAERLWATLEDPALRAAFQAWWRTRWTTTPPSEQGKLALNPIYLFQMDTNGQLVFPPPARELPQPRPLNPSDLNEAQAARWVAAQGFAPEFPASLTDAIENLRQFLALEPPERFAAAARFQLGVLLVRSHQPEAAAQEFQNLANAFPESSGESGLPLLPLALLKAAEQLLLVTNTRALSASALLDGACSNAVAVPSSITPYLLRAALPLDATLSTNLAARWQALWQEHQTAGTLHRAAQPSYLAAAADAVRRRTDDAHKTAFPFADRMPPPSKANPPRLFWFAMPKEFPATSAEEHPLSGMEEFWLASWIDSDADGDWYLCRPRFGQFLAPARTFSGSFRPSHRSHPLRRVGVDKNIVDLTAEGSRAEFPFFDPLLAELEKFRAQLPEYFGLSLELAGHVLISSNALPTFTYASGNKGGGRFYLKADTATAPPLLASAVHFEDGVESLRVGVHLTNPEMLYARQDTRNRLFGLLIGASALAAVIGFASARRAFRRQQQLAEMKSNFVSSVSHELRAPIASVRLMAESLERGKVAEPGKQREYFRFIVQECRRLGTLIENVLDFARIEQGRKQYGFEPTDLLALIRQTVQLMEPAATEREVTLTFSPPDSTDSPCVLQPLVDGAALQQALVNLLDNAIKHSPPRTAVSVALQVNNEPPSLHLSVQDQGPGIPVAEHEKIFERFYRRGSELRRETQGVGIGLSIVKHVAQAHSGRVRVESEAGQGTRFVIELPLNPSQPAT